MHLIILTGLSGSGKSIALRALEDSGFYCIDNLPATLLTYISEHLEANSQSKTVINKVAISIDSRSAGIKELPAAIEQLKKDDNLVEVIFLDSTIGTLVKRFSETRRKHPLSNAEKTLAESIASERALLSSIADLGHCIDTSSLSAKALRTNINQLIDQSSDQLALLFTSFGFKHGVPLDADFVFDVRSLPNPYYDETLRPFSGKDQAIIDFLEATPNATEMLNDIKHYIEKWLPSFHEDHRSYLNVAIGCTGGQHRSVYFVEQLSKYFKTNNQNVISRHREIEKKIHT